MSSFPIHPSILRNVTNYKLCSHIIMIILVHRLIMIMIIMRNLVAMLFFCCCCKIPPICYAVKKKNSCVIDTSILTPTERLISAWMRVCESLHSFSVHCIKTLKVTKKDIHMVLYYYNFLLPAPHATIIILQRHTHNSNTWCISWNETWILYSSTLTVNIPKEITHEEPPYIHELYIIANKCVKNDYGRRLYTFFTMLYHQHRSSKSLEFMSSQQQQQHLPSEKK